MDNEEGDKQVTEDDIPEAIDIEHHRSPSFTSQHATGAILSGPSIDQVWHLIFYADCVSIIKETANYAGDFTPHEDGSAHAGFQTSINQNDVKNFREDKARISMPINSLKSLRDLLNKRLPPEGNENE